MAIAVALLSKKPLVPMQAAGSENWMGPERAGAMPVAAVCADETAEQCAKWPNYAFKKLQDAIEIGLFDGAFVRAFGRVRAVCCRPTCGTAALFGRQGPSWRKTGHGGGAACF